MKFTQWFDNNKVNLSSESSKAINGEYTGIDWPRVIPFIAIHLTCLFAFVTGVSWIAIAVCLVTYFIRMFAITAFYHRYFSHKTFKTSRFMQAFFGFLGACSTQRGPLWWAAHHRHHHIHSDSDYDVHSPKHGFIKSHMTWFLNKKHFPTQHQRVKDLNQYPELRFLDRFDIVPPIIFAVLVLLLGIYIESSYPQLEASRWQILIWGFFISTILLSHVTFCINSLAHKVGTRRYNTNDDSRNNFLLAILTLGEGWHNNHHQFPGSVRQGIKWWEIDISYYILKFFEKVGLVWDLRYSKTQPTTALNTNNSIANGENL
ncbi:MAG: acyl-CoA desaturase [Kangiellaceae bacterium]|nr:acyl-CoA desaturase [Kangiellaceae bacterium]